ncbi:MAG: ImmA/IrrE family metallo-endopeptidase [Kiritimatiellae bacterium]|nr:ImmA/IrrE family metallo-endopeptidase [Kiritimatiellia bacterium]
MIGQFGASVKRMRAERGMSQSDLAAAAGMPNSQLCTIERGRTCPSVAVAARIAEALGLTLAQFFGGGPAKKRRAASPKPAAGDFTPVRAGETDFAKALPAVKGPFARCAIVENLSWLKRADRSDMFARSIRARLGAGELPFADLAFALRCAGVGIFEAKLPKPTQSVGIWNLREMSFSVVLNAACTGERKIYRLAYETGSVNLFFGNGCVPFEDEGPAHRALRDFAAEFLMPKAAVVRAVEAFGIGRDEWTMAKLCEMKSHFGVSAEAFALRLENLGLIEPALRENLRDRLRSRYKACPRSMEPPPRKPTGARARL